MTSPVCRWLLRAPVAIHIVSRSWSVLVGVIIIPALVRLGGGVGGGGWALLAASFVVVVRGSNTWGAGGGTWSGGLGPRAAAAEW